MFRKINNQSLRHLFFTYNGLYGFIDTFFLTSKMAFKFS